MNGGSKFIRSAGYGAIQRLCASRAIRHGTKYGFTFLGEGIYPAGAKLMDKN